MRFVDKEKTVLIVNDHTRLAGIPAEAHAYQVNGRTPLGWFIDRYRITQDKGSGIVNDPNAWFDDPRTDRALPPDRASQRGNRPYRDEFAGSRPWNCGPEPKLMMGATPTCREPRENEPCNVNPAN